MYLMDTLNQCASAIRSASPSLFREAGPMMWGYADLADRLKGAPRYLLDVKAVQMMVELTLGRPRVLRDAMAYCRVPYRRMWIEWADGDRQKFNERFREEHLEFAELRPYPERIGFLLEADETGRRGTATWAWTSPQSQTTGFPNVGCFQPHYDLDRVFPLDDEGRIGLLDANLAKIWKDNPIQLQAFLDIWRTCEHRLCSWGPSYLASLPNPNLALQLSRADVIGEYITIWTVLLMLTASRPVIWETPIDMGRLNKRRIKRRELPLLDHTRVTLKMAPHVERPVIRGELGYARKSPRIHMVSSYLARRGDRYWVVQPYWRGQGEVIHREVRVRG